MSNPSEPWVVLVATDLNDYLVAAQAQAVTGAALAGGQSNTWTTVSRDVANKIRSAIRGSIRNQVSMTPYSIPPDLKPDAMALIVERLQGRIPQLKLSEDQKRAADNARRTIERIQENKVVITAPPDPLVPDDQQRGTPTTIISSQRRLVTARTLRGLI